MESIELSAKSASRLLLTPEEEQQFHCFSLLHNGVTLVIDLFGTAQRWLGFKFFSSKLLLKVGPIFMINNTPTTPSKFNKASPVKHHPNPIELVRGSMITAAIAAATLRSKLARAIWLAACVGKHSVW